MQLGRGRRHVLRNNGGSAIVVVADDERFLMPPNGYLQMTGRGEIYVAFAGDAPMLAFPLETAQRNRAPKF